MADLQIDAEYITLAQLLKLMDVISSGGEAKHFLQSERVFINNQPEDRRGRKLYPGDTVTVLGQTVTIRNNDVNS